MTSAPFRPANLRSRAPDSASDLGLYAAPLALGVPVVAAALDVEPVRAATIAKPLSDPAAGGSANAATDPWRDDQPGTGASASASIGASTLQSSATGFKEADAIVDGKVVVLHVGIGSAPAQLPVSNLAPVTHTEASLPAALDPAPGQPVVPTADPAGVAALNAVGALTDNAAGSVAAIGQPLAALADGGVAVATSALHSTVGLVAATIEGLGDALGGLELLGGADPAGGIATLVGMVGATDLVALADLAAPVDGLLLALHGDGDAPTDDPAFPDPVSIVPAEAILGLAEPGTGALGLLGLLADDAI